MNLMKKRLWYFAATLLLLGIEVVIALFVRDTFIRPYVGDALVVIVLYTFVRIWFPENIKLLPFYLFLFAALVEGLQAIHIVELLGLSENRFFRVLIGATFDGKDILCYAVGCILTGIYEVLCRKIRERKEREHGIL